MKVRLLFLLSLIVILGGFYGSMYIPINKTMEFLAFEDHAERAHYERLKHEFPHQENMFVTLIKAEKGLHDFHSFRRLNQLCELLSKDPKTEQVLFLTRLNFPFRTGNIDRSRKMIPVSDSLKFERRFKKLHSYPDIRPKFISNDNKVAAIYIYAADHSSSKSFGKIIRHWAKLNPQFSAYLLGQSLSEENYGKRIQQDQQKLIYITLGLLFIGFSVFFRSVRSVLFLLWTICLSLALLFLLIFILRIELNALTVTIPVLVTILSLSDAVHVLEERQKSSDVGSTLRRLSPALLLTTLTTVAGFSMFLITESNALIEYALLAIAGLFISYFVNRFISFVFLLLFPISLKSDNNIQFSFSRRRTTTILTVLLLVFSTTFVLIQYRTDHYIHEDLEPNTEEYLGYDLIRKHFKGGRRVELFLEFKSGDLSAEIINRTEQLDARLRIAGLITDSYGIHTLVKRYNRYKHGGNPKMFTIPKEINARTINEIKSKEVLLRLNQIIGENGRTYKYSVSLRDIGAAKANELYKEIAVLVSKIFGKDQSFYIGGPSVIADKSILRLSSSLLLSLLFALLAIIFMIWFRYRSIKYVVAAIVVNTLPLMLVGTFILLKDHYFIPNSLMILTILLGVAVDDTIHFMERYSALSVSGVDSGQAINSTLNSSGMAIVKTSLLLCLGLCALFFSSFTFNVESAFYFILGILAALLTDLFILPQLLYTKKEQR